MHHRRTRWLRLESGHESFYDPNVYPSAVTCDEMTAGVLDEHRRIWTFHTPRGFGSNISFMGGPVPTPESVDCAPHGDMKEMRVTTEELVAVTTTQGSVYRFRADRPTD